MRSTTYRSPPSHLTALLEQFVPPVLVCLCVLSIPVASKLRFATEPAPRMVHGQTLSRLHRVRHLPAGTAAELLIRLDQVWGTAGSTVPGLAPRRLPSDLDQLSVDDRKQVFFRSLLPHVLDRNNRIAAERTRLAELSARTADGAELGKADRRFLNDLVDRYGLGVEIDHPEEQMKMLLGQVDVVPPSIALAQAAIESGWGTSRFTRLGNNLFGQWVFDRDRGIAPLRRPDGANYSLARFRSLGDAVDAYLRNLNGFSAYAEFRRLRRQMRAAGGPLDPYRLAAGLSSYSTRRAEYVREVRAVIRSNALTRFDQTRLALPEDSGLL